MTEIEPAKNQETDSTEVEQLRREMARLRQENSDLQIALQTTTEHGDLIEAELHQSNQRLQTEIGERRLAQAALQEILETVSRDKADLEMILKATAEHGDVLEYQLYTQAVETMRHSEALFRAISESTSILMILTQRSDGAIAYANSVSGDRLGVDTQALVGYKLYDFFADPTDNQRLQEILTADGYVRSYEMQVKRTDGILFWVSTSVHPLSLSGEQALLTTLYDISDRKTAEAALRQSQEQLRQQAQELEVRVEQRTAELRQQRQIAEQLLLNVLPQSIAERLKRGEKTIADSFSEATVLFADIANFTGLCSHVSPSELVELLNGIFSTFDQLADQRGLEKIKTIGDAYMVVGGLPNPSPDHVEAITTMAIDMLREISHFSTPDHQPITLRIGIHTGPVVAGVIGTRKFIYDLWGDTVNIASRMESHGEVGRIQVTQAVYQRLKNRYEFQERGAIDIKGKGFMTTYWLDQR
jgi:PAS domain S-box-containing protein